MSKMAKNSISPQFTQNPDVLRKFYQHYRVQREKIFGICTMAFRRETKQWVFVEQYHFSRKWKNIWIYKWNKELAITTCDIDGIDSKMNECINIVQKYTVAIISFNALLVRSWSVYDKIAAQWFYVFANFGKMHL